MFAIGVLSKTYPKRCAINGSLLAQIKNPFSENNNEHAAWKLSGGRHFRLHVYALILVSYNNELDNKEYYQITVWITDVWKNFVKCQMRERNIEL